MKKFIAEKSIKGHSSSLRQAELSHFCISTRIEWGKNQAITEIYKEVEGSDKGLNIGSSLVKITF